MKHAGAILLGIIALATSPSAWSAAPSDQYSDLNDGTVRDNKTKLVWQQQTSDSLFNWDDAHTYCRQLTLGGFSSGWRLPTKLELETLVDHRVSSPKPTIDSTAFPSAPPAHFWTSTRSAGIAERAWFVDFYSGESITSLATDTKRVRCVR